MEFQFSYFKSWKMMLWECYTQYVIKFGKLSSGHRTGKRSVFIPIPKKGNAKECSNYHTIALISHASKLMPKILRAKLQQYMNHEVPEFHARLRKVRGTRDQISNIRRIIRKAKSSRKTSISALLTMSKSSTMWITINFGKFWKRWEYQTTWPASWETCVQVRKQQLELDMEQHSITRLKASKFSHTTFTGSNIMALWQRWHNPKEDCLHMIFVRTGQQTNKVPHVS